MQQGFQVSTFKEVKNSCAFKDLHHVEWLKCMMAFTIMRRGIAIVVSVLLFYTKAAVVTFIGKLVVLIHTLFSVKLEGRRG